MFARMTIRRAVAAQRFAALLARAQMDPGRADLYALFTFQTLRMFDILDCVQMRTTSISHSNIILFRVIKTRNGHKASRSTGRGMLTNVFTDDSGRIQKEMGSVFGKRNFCVPGALQ
jgi:hypothetical protein